MLIPNPFSLGTIYIFFVFLFLSWHFHFCFFWKFLRNDMFWGGGGSNLQDLIRSHTIGLSINNILRLFEILDPRYKGFNFNRYGASAKGWLYLYLSSHTVEGKPLPQTESFFFTPIWTFLFPLWTYFAFFFVRCKQISP